MSEGQEAEHFWCHLQHRLADDPEGQTRDALLETLGGAAREIKRQMDAGVPPGEFDRLQKLQRGYTAAAEVVTVAWGAYRRA